MKKPIIACFVVGIEFIALLTFAGMAMYADTHGAERLATVLLIIILITVVAFLFSANELLKASKY